MSIISRVWLSSHWYDAGMYIMHSSGKLFMTFLGGYIKLSVLKIVMKKAYASEFFYQEPICKLCEFSLQVHSKILVKQPMHASGLKTSSSDESL